MNCASLCFNQISWDAHKGHFCFNLGAVRPHPHWNWIFLMWKWLGCDLTVACVRPLVRNKPVEDQYTFISLEKIGSCAFGAGAGGGGGSEGMWARPSTFRCLYASFGALQVRFPFSSFISNFLDITIIHLILIPYDWLRDWMDGWVDGWKNEWVTTFVRLVVLDKPVDPHLVTQFPSFYGNQMFITVFTNNLHLSLSWARWIQSTPSELVSLQFVLIIFYHRELDLPSGILPLGFFTRPLYALSCPLCLLQPGLVSTLDTETYMLYNLLLLLHCWE
jgi:hypothetical protein